MMKYLVRYDLDLQKRFVNNCLGLKPGYRSHYQATNWGSVAFEHRLMAGACPEL